MSDIVNLMFFSYQNWKNAIYYWKLGKNYWEQEGILFIQETKNKKIKRQNQYQREDGPNNRWKEGWIDQMTEKLIELYVCSLQAKLQNLKYGLRANLHAR